MKNSFFLTGSTGFNRINLIFFVTRDYQIKSYKRNSFLNFDQDVVIHLTGKAHDFKKKYQIQTNITKPIPNWLKKLFDAFLDSETKVFITLSSVKAAADEVLGELMEEHMSNPITHYGKSKLLAEQYILSKEIPEGKRVFI